MTLRRRTFIKQAATAGAALPLALPALIRAVPANSKVRHVSVGGGGMPWGDIQSLARSKYFELVGVCDVDQGRLGPPKQKFPKIATFTDWRKMYDKLHKDFDSVNVGTPDHTHAPATMAAIALGKHCYTQKPLTHDVYESRQLAEAAAKAKVVTQMGIQVHSTTQYRLPVVMVRSGVIGKVKEVYTWSHKNWGGGGRPDGSDPVPATLDWESWIGTAPMRPFKSRVYHPGQWRRWLDFGTGTFGDMGCHIYDPVYNAIGVKYPLSVRSEGPAPFKETWPTSAEVHYVFPGNEFTDGDTVKFAWYDGGRKPPQNVRKLIGKISWPAQGSITIGTKGVMLLPHVGSPRFLPEENFPRSIYPKLPPADHRMQFIDAIRGEGGTTAGFDYSGPLTETILLGGVAVRFPGQTLNWDAEKLQVTNVPEANQYVRRSYRKGWEVAGL